MNETFANTEIVDDLSVLTPEEFAAKYGEGETSSEETTVFIQEDHTDHVI